MFSPHAGVSNAKAVAPFDTPVSSGRPAGSDGQSRRMKPLMRAYEIAHLTPGGEISETTRLAPASDLFESCFAALGRGALLTTDHGPRAIEDILPGDRVMTTSHGMQRVLWRGRTQVLPGSDPARSSLVSLVRLTQDALGFRRPSHDLILGPAARIAYRGHACRQITGYDTVFVPVRDLVDHDTVIEVQPVSTVDVFQIGTESHARLAVAGNIEIETLHPGLPHVLRQRPETLPALAALFPQVERLDHFGPLLHPRCAMQDLALDSAV